MAPPRKYKSDEERRQAKSERARLKRASLTAEERQKILERKREDKKRRMEKMNEAERKEYRRKQSEDKKKRRSMMTPEGHEETEIKHRHANSKLANMTEAEKEEIKTIRREEEKHRKYFRMQARLAEMTKEEREEYNRKCRESQRKMKSEMTEEQKKEASQKIYFYHQARLARMTPEERRERMRKNVEAFRRWRKTLTGEKLERYKESMRRSAKKFFKSEKYKSSKMYQKMLEYQRHRTATETPGQRQKRLRRYKINQAVRKLRMELESDGVSQEEIEEKTMELKEMMWAEPLPPPEEISNYSTRPRQSKRPRQQSNSCPLETPHVDSSIAVVAPPETMFNYLTSEERRPWQQLNPNPPETRLLFATEPADSSKIDYSIKAMSPQYCQTDIFQENEENSCHDDDCDYALAFEDNIDLDEESIDPHISPQEVGKPVPSSTTPLESIKCPHCSSHFPRKSDLTAHIISEHPKKCWKCPMCKQVMISPAELKEHFKSDCQHAAKIALPVSSKSMNSNQNDSGSDNIFSCMKCDPLAPDLERTFRSPKCLREHVKLRHLESFWPCSKCDILKYSERSLRIHEKVCRSRLKNKL